MATAADKTTTRDIPRLELRAEIAPSTIDVEKRTVEITWTTGARVLRGFFEQFFEELSLDPKHVRMERLNNGAPLLDDHNRDGTRSVIGVVESAKLEKVRGWAKVRFDSGADGEEVFRKVRERILRHVSVGYATYKMVKVEDGSTTIPVYRAIDWEPHELSVTPVGADAGAGFRAQTNDSNPCEFITRQEQHVMAEPENTTITPSADKLEETVAVAATTAARKLKVEDAKARAEAEANAAAEATTAERVRSSEIRKLGKQSGLGDEWATKLIDTGVAVEIARKAAFEHMLHRDDAEFNPTGALRVQAGEDANEKFIRGASAWMFERTGTRNLIEAAKAKQPGMFKGVDTDGGEFRGLTPVELARECLERSGVKTRGMDRMQMIGMAFTHRSSNYQVAGDFAVLLENVLGKVLWGAYVTLPLTWDQFCGTDSVPDFRASNRYYTGAFPSLAVIPEHGEYKNAAIPDGAKRAVTTERKGQILGLSREAILNDDMGALTNVAIEAGKASGRTIEEDAYAFLALNSGLGPTQSDSQPFFHSNRANVNATGAALSAAAIDADASVMSYQKDPSGKAFLNLQPAVLLVPRSLRGTAQTINDSQYDPDTVANKAQMKPNVVRGLFGNVIGSPYFASNATRRYLFADPAITPAIVVAYLEGYARGPIMETKEGWRTDGVEWKVTMYAKVQAGDPKGAVTNAGV